MTGHGPGRHRNCSSARDAVDGADLVVLATSSPTPVIEDTWIMDGAHVVSVGACRPDQREMAPELVARGRLFVDSRAAAIVESGDVVIGMREQRFEDDHIAGELGELVLGRVEGRTSPDEITIFKSLGMAVEDVVTADLVFRQGDRNRSGHRADPMTRACFVAFAASSPSPPASTAYSASANPESRAIIERAFQAAYNLDHAEAIALLDKAVAADPNDPDAHRAAAVIAWLRIGFLRGSITVDDYLGSVSKPNINMLPPPPDEAQRFQRHIARALQLVGGRPAAASTRSRSPLPDGLRRRARRRRTARPSKARLLASFRAARRAYDAHERVLELDPSRKDAGLIVGTYRYVVSALSLPIRVMAYVAGFGGGKERGSEDDRGGRRLPQPDADRREVRAAAALQPRSAIRRRQLRVAEDLQKQYPAQPAVVVRGRRHADSRASGMSEADRVLSEGIRRRDADRRDRMFGEDALWHYKRGLARARLGRLDGARQDLGHPIAREARDWVRGPAHAEFGQIAARPGDREQARRHYRLAIELSDRGNDPAGRSEAEPLLSRVRSERMKKRRNWLLVLFGVVVLVVFVGIGAIIAVAAWFQQNLRGPELHERTGRGNRLRRRAASSSGNGRRCSNYATAGPAYSSDAPDVPSQDRVETLHVLAWDPDDEKLAQGGGAVLDRANEIDRFNSAPTHRDSTTTACRLRPRRHPTLRRRHHPRHHDPLRRTRPPLGSIVPRRSNGVIGQLSN